jgi:hypothetical protein
MGYLNSLSKDVQGDVLKKAIPLARKKSEEKKKRILLLREEIINRVKDRCQKLDDQERNRMSRRLKKEGLAVLVAENNISADDADTLQDLLEGEMENRQFYHYFSEHGRRKLFTGTGIRELRNGKIRIQYVRDEDGAVTVEEYSRFVLCTDMICGDLIVIA